MAPTTTSSTTTPQPTQKKRTQMTTIWALGNSFFLFLFFFKSFILSFLQTYAMVLTMTKKAWETDSLKWWFIPSFEATKGAWTTVYIQAIFVLYIYFVLNFSICFFIFKINTLQYWKLLVRQVKYIGLVQWLMVPVSCKSRGLRFNSHCCKFCFMV